MHWSVYIFWTIRVSTWVNTWIIHLTNMFVLSLLWVQAFNLNEWCIRFLSIWRLFKKIAVYTWHETYFMAYRLKIHSWNYTIKWTDEFRGTGFMDVFSSLFHPFNPMLEYWFEIENWNNFIPNLEATLRRHFLL